MTETTETDPLAELHEANKLDLQAVNAAGFDVEVLQDRLVLSVLIELLLPSGTPLRSTFDAVYTSNLHEHLQKAKAEVTRRKLLEGVQPPPMPKGHPGPGGVMS